MDILFSAISIFYAFRGLQIAATVARNWAKLRGPNFTTEDKNLAGQASFFLAVPIGVFFHELGHAVFVLLFGGQIEEFGYRVFWGFVSHIGTYTPGEGWTISVAGTVASLIFGVVIWLLLKNNPSPTFRYFGLRAFRFQIFFSLIYYPVFTLIGFYGDWRTIYDFTATPILSGATAVIHAGLLLLFWQAERNGFFEMGAFGSVEANKKLTALEERAAASPYDTDLQIELISAYRQGGLTSKAKQAAQKFVKDNPNSAEGYLQLAVIEETGKQQVPSKAKDYAQKAIQLGLGKPGARGLAHQIIGRFNLGVGNSEEAIEQFTQGIGAAKTVGNEDLYTNLLYNRALVYRRKEQYDAAFQDIQQAIQLARSRNREELIVFLNNELETIARHSGRSPDQFKVPPG